MARITSSLVVTSFAFAIGCGGNPVRPSQAVRPAALTISGPEVLLTDASAKYDVMATLPNTSKLVFATWTSSSTEVATVDANGRLTGRAHGSTTLTAAYAGVSATLLVRVVNNYAGVWNGQGTVRACTDAGDLSDHDGGWCAAGDGRIGTVRAIEIVLEQKGSTLSEISGTVADDSATALTGFVTPDGRLNLRGSWSLRDWDGDVFAVDGIRDWDTSLTAPGVMAGRWAEDYKSVSFRIGSAYMESDITLSRRPPSPTRR